MIFINIKIRWQEKKLKKFKKRWQDKKLSKFLIVHFAIILAVLNANCNLCKLLKNFRTKKLMKGNLYW